MSKGAVLAWGTAMAMAATVCVIGLGDRQHPPSMMASVTLDSRESKYAAMCAMACDRGGRGIWGKGGSLKTCAVCRLADKQAQLGAPQVRREGPRTILGGGDNDALVDENGMIYFPEEFSGCNDNGDSDDFRNNERIDCVHEARKGWYEKGAHVLDSDGLSFDDLAPSEVKHRIMTYCMVRFQEQMSKTEECYEALVDALTGSPEPVHIRLRWDDPMPHPAEDYQDESDLPVAGRPARVGGGGSSVGSIIAAYVEGMCANSDGFDQGSVLCGQ